MSLTLPTPGARAGVGLALASAVLFGVSAPLAKLLLGQTPPQLLAGLLYLGSGGGLLIVWLVRKRATAGEAALTRRDLPWLTGAVLAGGVAAPLLLLVGLARTPASGASLLLNLEGVFTALVAWFVVGEQFDRRIALGMAAILAGGAVLSWGGRFAWGGASGPLLIAGACLCWAVDNNLTQRLSAGDPVQIAMLKGLVAGLGNTAIALLLGAHLPGAGHLSSAMLLGLVSYGVSLVCFVLALRQLGTARTGAYFATAPFVGAALSLLLFHEHVTPTLVAAATLMAVGVALHVSERHTHQHGHESLEHEHAHTHDAHHQHAHGVDDPAARDGRPHSHPHRHEPLVHAHEHFPDLHHRHAHDGAGAPDASGEA